MCVCVCGTGDETTTRLSGRSKKEPYALALFVCGAVVCCMEVAQRNKELNRAKGPQHILSGCCFPFIEE